MSYSEVLETSEDGRYRVLLVRDEYADEPYDDGASPLMRLDNGHYGWHAEHITGGTSRPTDADSYVEAAAERWGSDFGWLEKYLRAYHGATTVKTWHSGEYWYITYDPAAWRAWCGAPEGSADMSEYRAYCEGDVWGYSVEKRVTWHTDDPDYEDEERWEGTDDSCWGFYGSDGANGEYLESTAREALASAVEADAETRMTQPARVPDDAVPALPHEHGNWTGTHYHGKTLPHTHPMTSGFTYDQS